MADEREALAMEYPVTNVPDPRWAEAGGLTELDAWLWTLGPSDAEGEKR